MYTLLDVTEELRPLGMMRGMAGMPVGYPQSPKLKSDTGRKITLPKSEDGLWHWSAHTPNIEAISLTGDQLEAARVHLLTSPTFVISVPATPGTVDEYVKEESRANAKASGHVLAVGVALDDGTKVYGVTRIELIEAGLGFGKTMVVSRNETWHASIHNLAVELAGAMREVHGAPIAPEAGKPAWKTAVLLLSGAPESRGLTNDLRFYLRRVAGLFRVNLEIRIDAATRRADVIATMKKAPPSALLVMASSVPDGSRFSSALQSVRPGAYVGDIETPELVLEDQLDEYLLHLFAIQDTTADANGSGYPTEWPKAAKYLKELQGPHFRLTGRAAGSLAGNSYPDAARMVEHVHLLEKLAARWSREPALGGGLKEFAKTEFELNIALFDDSLVVKKIVYEEITLHPLPHVKVDDATTADKCGRIYFAMDHDRRRFVVDHVGLHDYGRSLRS